MRVELMRRRGNAWEIRGVGSFDHRYEPRNDGAKSPAERKADSETRLVTEEAEVGPSTQSTYLSRVVETPRGEFGEFGEFAPSRCRAVMGKLSWVSLGVGGDECDMCLLYLPSIRVRARGNGL